MNKQLYLFDYQRTQLLDVGQKVEHVPVPSTGMDASTPRAWSSLPVWQTTIGTKVPVYSNQPYRNLLGELLPWEEENDS